MKPKYLFEIKPSRNGEFYWRVTHRNGNEIARSSETYKRRHDCRRGLERLILQLAELDYEIVSK